MNLKELLFSNCHDMPLPPIVERNLHKLNHKFYLLDRKEYFKKFTGRTYEGYQGNWGDDTKKWYSKTAIIFFPKVLYMDLLLRDVSLVNSYDKLSKAILSFYRDDNNQLESAEDAEKIPQTGYLGAQSNSICT